VGAGLAALNNAWKARLDEIVPYLQQLEDAGIPVLWRFLHEMNDGWSWWGGRSGAAGSARLYQISHDYLKNSKGLSNLIWVWNLKDLDAAGMSSYYPGTSYADVVSLDAWNANFPATSYYTTLSGIAGSKPMALAEVLTTSNSNAAIQALYFDARVLNRGELTLPTGGTTPPSTSPATGVGPVRGLAGKCVDVRADASADGTAVQLYTCATGTAQTWTVGSDGTLRALGKPQANPADGTQLQIWDCNGGAQQRWTLPS
jgi:mannan endo-1,4-beta-mannosidase